MGDQWERSRKKRAGFIVFFKLFRVANLVLFFSCLGCCFESYLFFFGFVLFGLHCNRVSCHVTCYERMLACLMIGLGSVSRLGGGSRSRGGS